MSFTIVFRLFFVLCLRNSGTIAQVTLHPVNEQCSEDDLTFSCETTESGLLVWTLVALPGVTGVEDSFGQSLNSNPNAVRITSTDTSLGPNPSSITIHNATAADNGATVQCRIVNMEMRNVITLSIRNLLDCSANVSVTDIGSSTVSLNWTEPVCSDVLPMHYLVQWTQESTSGFERSDVIPNSTNSYNISSLLPNTAYDFFLVVVDQCGNMTAGRQSARTLELNGTDGNTSPTLTNPTDPPPPPPWLIVLIVVLIIIIVAAPLIIILIIFVYWKKKQGKGPIAEPMTAPRNHEEMQDKKEQKAKEELNYVTVEHDNAPPAEPKKPKQAEAVQYTGVNFAQS